MRNPRALGHVKHFSNAHSHSEVLTVICRVAVQMNEPPLMVQLLVK